jgi:hypothetical protein
MESHLEIPPNGPDGTVYTFNSGRFGVMQVRCIGSGIDQESAEWLANQGYVMLRLMPDGELAGVSKYMFTHGLDMGVEPDFWRTRWCYNTRFEAEKALEIWDGTGDPPGLWIKQKPEERRGPGSPDARY